EGMAWSTDTVVPETVRRAEAKGLRMTWLPRGFDIDTPADLERLQVALAHIDGPEPRHTRQFFLEHTGWKTCQRRPGQPSRASLSTATNGSPCARIWCNCPMARTPFTVL